MSEAYLVIHETMLLNILHNRLVLKYALSEQATKNNNLMILDPPLFRKQQLLF